MEFALGMLAGMIIMWAIAKRLMLEWKKEMKELRNFDTWKEWKNQKQ